MAAASLIVRVSAQVAEFQKSFADATRTTQKFERDFANTASSVSAQQKRISNAFSSFSGDKLAREASAVAKAVEQIGGASKLTATEQARVNAVMTEALAKYKALGQEAPAGMKALAAATKAVEAPTANLSKQLDSISGGLRTFGSAARSVGIGLTAAMTVPLVAVGTAVIKLGMDAVESENLVSVSFGNMRGAADEWSKGLSKSLGLNEFELRKTSGTLFNMTTSMGLARDEAFKMSTGVAELAADMSSFRNIPMEEALNKIRSGLVGESEPLKNIGILVDEATVKTEAYRMGLVRQGAELTQTQKVTARWSAILRQTTNDQGDLARTLESPANQLRIMRTRLEEAGTALGVSLMPLFQEFVKVLGAVVPRIQTAVQFFTALPEPVRLGAVAFAGLLATLGPATLALGAVANASASLITLMPKLTAAIGVSRAAGLTGAASNLAGVLLGAGGLVAALGALAVAWSAIKVGEINAQGDAYERARGILGRGVSTYKEATAVIAAFEAGMSGKQMQSATFTTAEAWRKGAEAAGKLGSAVGETKLTLDGFTTGMTATQIGIANAAARTREYEADMKKLGAEGQASVRTQTQQGVAIKLLAKDFGVAEESLDRYLRSLKDSTIAGLRNELSGRGAIKAALEMVDALKGLPPVYTLTRDAQDRVNKAMEEALDVYRAQGREAPDAIRRVAAATMDLSKLSLGFQDGLPAAFADVGRQARLAIPEVAKLFAFINENSPGVATSLDSLVSASARWRVEMPKAPDAAGKEFSGLSDKLREVTRLLDYLADGVGDNAFGDAIREISNIADAWSVAADAAADYTNATNLAGKAMALLQGAGALAQATSSDNRTSATVGGAVTGMQLGMAVAGPYGAAVGLVAGAIVGLVRSAGQGREAVEAFAKSFGGFDGLREKLGTLGDEGERLWVNLTQGVGSNNPEQAAAAVAAIQEAFINFKADPIGDAIKASGFQTRAQLEELATTAKGVYERMRDSGEFTATSVQAAFERMQEAQIAAFGDSTATDSLKARLAELDTEFNTLFKSIENEAPEEVMGDIEKMARERMKAIELERMGVESEMDKVTKGVEDNLAGLGSAAEMAARAIEEALSHIRIEPIRFPPIQIPGMPGVPSGGATLNLGGGQQSGPGSGPTTSAFSVSGSGSSRPGNVMLDGQKVGEYVAADSNRRYRGRTKVSAA